MAWLYKQRGSSNWWIGYRVNGRQVLRSTGTDDKAKAEQELAKLELLDQAHKAGTLSEEFFRLVTRKEFARDTFTAYVKQWLAECKDLSPVTRKKYSDTLEEFATYLGATDTAPLLRDIQPDTVGAFLRKKRAETSTATAKLHRKVISAFFRYAVDNRALQISPVPSTRSLKLTKDSKKVRRAFTLKELRTLFEKAPTDFWRYMILMGFYCGQRMGDLITLPWGAVDFEQNQIRMVTSKTHKSLTIPLRAELKAFLGQLRDKAGTVKPGNSIWPDEAARYEKHGAGPFSNDFYDDVLLPAGLVPPRSHQKATPEGEDGRRRRTVNSVSFHCLRHTFVSLLKLTGGSQAVAKELAGHSSDQVSDLYTHVPEEALSKAINALPEVVTK